MKIKVKHQMASFRSILIVISISLVISSAAISFMCYKLSSFLLHKRNLDNIEVTLDPREYRHQEVTFRSKKYNTSLKGILFSANPQSKKTIIIVHGYNQNRMLGGRTNTIAKYFLSIGYNILTFDLWGEDSSGGNRITFGYHEKYYVMGAIDFLKELGKEGEKIALLGFSMGAVTAIETAEEDDRVDAVIADSPFRDLKLFLTRELVGSMSEDSSFKTYNMEDMPYWSVLSHVPFKDKIIDLTAKICDINIDEVSPMNAVKFLSKKPVFLIHGKDDRLIPYSNSQYIYKSFDNNPNKKIWLTEKAGHIESFDAYKQEYLDNIKVFLNKNISD